MSSIPQATPAAAARLLTPNDHTLIIIDFQSQMAFATRSIDIAQLRSNAALIANAAAGFKVPTILTTAAEKTFSGPMFDEILTAFPRGELIDRTTMNAWEDKRITDQVNRIGKGKVVFAGLWTGVCIVDPVLSAIEQGFDAYFIADACGDVTPEAHERAVQRMIQVGAQPMTSVQYLLELQRDWARTDTYNLTTGIVRKHAGAYGIGIAYARAVFGEH
jgi:nicotinamidase-related amidase